MVEMQISQLFLRQGPRSDGALPEDEVVRLNLALARRYHSLEDRCAQMAADCNLPPPPEPLPAGDLRFPAFRRHLHRALKQLSESTEAAPKEEVLRRVLADISGRGSKEVSSAVNVGSAPRTGRVAKPMGDDGEVFLSTVSGVDEVRETSPCWTPNVIPRKQLQQWEDAYRRIVDDIVTAEKSQETIELAKGFGSFLLRSSKQVLEVAKEYGAAAKDDPAAILRVAAPAACEEKLRRVTPSPPVTESIMEVPVLFRWRFDAGDGLHADPRSQPAISASRTGHHVMPGEEFEVSQELVGEDAVIYLKLADGRGWLFDHKPGVGIMCHRVCDKQKMSL